MRYRAKWAAPSRGARLCLMATVVAVVAAPLSAAASSSNVQDGSNRSRTSQRGSAQTGDAIGGGQVAGAVTNGGTLDLNATNQATDSLAESGDASGSNTMAGVFVGNQSTAPPAATGGGVATGVGSAPESAPQPVGALGPLAPAGAEASSGSSTAPAVPGGNGAGLAGPPGPLGPLAADSPSDASNVQNGDNTLTYSQRADIHTGDADAGGQIVGTVINGGSANVTLSNTATNSDAFTGNGQMDNTLRDVHVGSSSQDVPSGSVGAIGPLIPDDLQVTSDPAPAASDSSASAVYPPDIVAAIHAIDAAVARPGSIRLDHGGAFDAVG